MEIIEGQAVVRFEDLFKENVTKIQLIITFVALLELIRLGLARVYQESQFGSIFLINPEKQPAVEAVIENPV